MKVNSSVFILFFTIALVVIADVEFNDKINYDDLYYQGLIIKISHFTKSVTLRVAIAALCE